MNLLFVLPFHQHDAHLAVQLCKWIADLGGCPYDVALLYDKTSVGGKPRVDHREVARAAVGAFKRVLDPFQLVIGTNPGRDSWPAAPNRAFSEACRWIFDRQQEYQAFWFFEPDLTPLTRDWHKHCLHEYENIARKGKPHWGAFSPWFDDRFPGVPQGNHLQGCSIYGSDVWNLKRVNDRNRVVIHNNMVQYLEGETEAMLRRGEKPQAFDVYLWRNMTGEIAHKNGEEVYQLAYRTKLLQHAWRSSNFREESGEIRFDMAVYRGEQTTVDPSAVIFHGCKDGSLLRLMRERLGIPEQERELVAPPPVSVALPPGVRMEVVEPTRGSGASQRVNDHSEVVATKLPPMEEAAEFPDVIGATKEGPKTIQEAKELLQSTSASARRAQILEQCKGRGIHSRVKSIAYEAGVEGILSKMSLSDLLDGILAKEGLT